jgi:inner membrane transporter RhtA
MPEFVGSQLPRMVHTLRSVDMTQTAKTPALAAICSLVSLQVGAAFAKTIFPLVGPEGVAALRIGLAAALLAMLCQPWKIRIERRHWRYIVPYALLIGTMNLLIYRAFNYIPVGIAIAIEVLGPLAVALFASRRKLDLVWIGLALIGVALLPLGSVDGKLDMRGVGFSIAAAACWGIYIVVGPKVADLGSRGVALGMILASLLVVPIGFSHAGLALLDTKVLLFGIAVAAMSSALPFLLDIYALKRLPANVFGILMSASPAVSAVAGLLVLREVLSSLQWLGVAAISLACIGATQSSSRAHSKR